MAELKFDFQKMAEGFIKTAKKKGMFVGWWIPVSERLPKKGEQVLCCNKSGSVFTSAITYINSNGMVAFGQHYEVIAWMPLPQPYKGESEVQDDL